MFHKHNISVPISFLFLLFRCSGSGPMSSPWTARRGIIFLWPHYLIKVVHISTSDICCFVSEVAAVAICVRHLSRTCRRFWETFCFACSYWLDLANQQICFRSRLLQFMCGTCRNLSAIWGNFLLRLFPLVRCHLNFDLSNQQLYFRSRLKQLVYGTGRSYL